MLNTTQHCCDDQYIILLCNDSIRNDIITETDLSTTSKCVSYDEINTFHLYPFNM